MSHGSLYKLDVVAPRSKFYQGPFGRLVGDLDPWFPEPFDPNTDPKGLEKFLLKIANEEMIERPGLKPGEIISTPGLIDELDAEFNSTIPAGYTYFGQFVDHDITFDPASSLMRQNDPSGLLNHRTPRLDLDNIYGRGPDDSPYLYDHSDTNGGKLDKFLLGRIAGTNFPDLPRSTLDGSGRALIGDKRNDENAIVSQLQLAFLMAHNTLADRARAAGAKNTFEAARKTLRWLYQWVVWHDFVSRIASKTVFDAALKLEDTPDGRKRWELGLDDVYDWKNQPFIPVEFSVAAYRFGHSMVRDAYQTNFPHRGVGKFVPIFDNTGAADPDDLRGFRPMQLKNTVQWDWFLDMTSSFKPRFPQFAHKIDAKLANSLSFLHEGPKGSQMNVLAFRNLLRGVRMELPAGTAVAKKWGLKPLDIPQNRDALWFYILKEAETGSDAGDKLGPVGSAIVCATFAGLLLDDPNSYLLLEPNWTPDDAKLLKPGEDNVDKAAWGLQSIIRLSGLPVDGGGFNAFA